LRRRGDDADRGRRHPGGSAAGQREQAVELAGHAVRRQPADHGATGRLHRAHAEAQQQGEGHEHLLLHRAEQAARRADRIDGDDEEQPVGRDVDDADGGDDDAGDGELHGALAADQIVDPAAQEGAGNREHRQDDAEDAERQGVPAECRLSVDASEGDDGGQAIVRGPARSLSNLSRNRTKSEI